MSEIRTHEDQENSPDYQRGYRDAIEDVKRDLAATLRVHALDQGDSDIPVLSDRQVREIYTGVFGVMATEEEFGEEPEGFFHLTSLEDHWGAEV